MSLHSGLSPLCGRRWSGPIRPAEILGLARGQVNKGREVGWTSTIAVVKVRREKALDFSGCNSRPGTGSLHPVAIETMSEATKLSELSMERIARRFRERAGRNESKR